jgi:uncharacterized membrane protein
MTSAIRKRRAPQPTAPTPGSVAAATRLRCIDALRGCAICLMIVYHFSFDLNYFGWIKQDFNNDIAWLGFRALIVTLFLFAVGVSLQLASAASNAPRRFWLRFARIAGCAALVSLGSYLMFPQTFIYFGILHFIALASLLAWPLVKAGSWNLLIAVAALAIGNGVQHPFFDQPFLHWLGLMTHKPRTEDYVPLLPWFGVVALGLYAGPQLAQHKAARLNAASPRALAWLGRHSLLIYMLHQPLLIGALWLAHDAWR